VNIGGKRIRKSGNQIRKPETGLKKQQHSVSYVKQGSAQCVIGNFIERDGIPS